MDSDTGMTTIENVLPLDGTGMNATSLVEAVCDKRESCSNYNTASLASFLLCCMMQCV